MIYGSHPLTITHYHAYYVARQAGSLMLSISYLSPKEYVRYGTMAKVS